eukprot:1129726-Pyramimonas_sp.AAC.1
MAGSAAVAAFSPPENSIPANPADIAARPSCRGAEGGRGGSGEFVKETFTFGSSDRNRDMSCGEDICGTSNAHTPPDEHAGDDATAVPHRRKARAAARGLTR